MPEPSSKQNTIVAPDRLDVLPTIRVPIASREIGPRLEAAARRGKFAGFVPGSGNALFRVKDFGGPFESVLTARADDAGAGPPGTSLRFELRLRPVLAWVYLAVLVVTVWPGVWLTDSMLRTYFTGYDFQTWMWYLPLTVPFVPWAMWASIRKSRLRGREQAVEILHSIAKTLGGEIEGQLPTARRHPPTSTSPPESPARSTVEAT
jgi:hypothetical protein